jgi:hypothetical protein
MEEAAEASLTCYRGRRMAFRGISQGKITFTPKSVVDRGIAESLADFAAGRSFGPFKTDKELINSLHQESAKVRSKTKAHRKTRN